MPRQFVLMYAWLIRSLLFFFPDYPPVMQLRGALYGVFMKRGGRNFQVAHSALLICLDGLEVGNDVYIANNTVLLCGGGIHLGDEVMIAHNSVISSSNHTRIDGSFRWGSRIEEPVLIGRGAWVGANCTMVSGSELPAGCVLAAGSVMVSRGKTEDVTYAGVPANVLEGKK